MSEPRQSVLIVDDQVEVANLLVRMLQIKGFEAQCVGTGGQGLAAARAQVFDVIMLDIGLPDMDGIEVCRQLKADEKTRDIPVVMITGLDATEEKVRAFETGATDYLTKPFDLAEVQARLAALLQHRRTLRKAVAATQATYQRTQEDLLRIGKALDSASDAILIVDTALQPIYTNFGFTSLLGLSLEQAREPGRLAGLFEDARALDSMSSACLRGQSWSGEVQLRAAGERTVTALCRGSAILDERLARLGAVYLFTDITQRKRLEQDLLFLADFDPLTSLPNRRSFGRLLEEAIERAAQRPAAHVLFIDLDNFKVVNDSAGHRVGDTLLNEIAQVLKRNLRPGDALARFGGDEFTVLLNDAEESAAVAQARRILRLLSEVHFSHGGEQFPISLSIGIAAVATDTSAEDVLARADSACNYVKSRGRNGCQVFKTEQFKIGQLTAEANWASQVKQALREERIELWLQPVVPLSADLPGHYEVLVRLRQPDGTIIAPSHFIGAAERFGLMEVLDRYIVQRGVRLLQAHQELRLAINLSAMSLNDPELPGFIETEVRQAGVDPHRLSFEITETVIIQNLEQSVNLILQIKELGCSFALDDFGSGASSMTYLRHLPVDYLKIDGAFIKQIDTDPINRALVKSMNEVAHILGKRTVAEFVGNAESLRVVKELGLDYAQGWHLSEAKPPGEFLKLPS